MLRIMQDVIDVIARQITPKLTDMAQSVKNDLSKEERMDIEMVTAILQDWDGNFGDESIQGTIYTHA